LLTTNRNTTFSSRTDRRGGGVFERGKKGEGRGGGAEVRRWVVP
jgi:hypothetical protein